MKSRTRAYLGTFVNNEEGISSYKLMVKHIRNTVTGGRFVKMYRGNKRRKTHYGNAGCSVKDGSTHFDVYLLPRTVIKENNYSWSRPQFYGWTLQ